MDGSAINGVELNDSDVGIGGSSSMMSECNCSRMLSRIYVEGYDTSLSGYDFVEGMRKHFASCGDVIHVHIPGYRVSSVPSILNSFSLVYLRGEGAEEKALKLSGGDMGGHKVVAKPYPFNATDLDPVLSLTRDSDNSQQFTMVVTGYDISLHASHVEHALFEHFSQCGRVLSACAPHSDIEEFEGVLDSIATVTLLGQAAVEKALQLCGCDVKGLGFFQVTGVCPPLKIRLPIMTPPSMWTDGSLMIPPPDMPRMRMSRRTDGSFVFTPPPRMPNNGSENMTASEKKKATVKKALHLLGYTNDEIRELGK